MGRRKRNFQGSFVKSEDGDDVNGESNLSNNGKLDLFQVMANAAIEGYLPIEQIIEIAYSYGAAHGEVLSKKFKEKAYLKAANGVNSNNGKSVEIKAENAHSSSNGHKSQNETKSVPNESSVLQEKAIPMELGELSETYRLKSSYKSTIDEKSFLPSTEQNKMSSDLSLPTVVPDLKGVYLLNSTNVTSSNQSGHRRQLHFTRYQSFLEYFHDKKIFLGDYDTPEEAAQAHDRALIRCLGPMNCPDDKLNYSIRIYGHDKIELFSCHDLVLKQGLFGMSGWKGVQDCDFSFLIIAIPTYQEIQRMRLMKNQTSTDIATTSSSSSAVVIA
jgi:hypothetical protein